MRNKIFKLLIIIAAIGAVFSIFAAGRTYYLYWKSKNLPGFQIQKIFEEAEKNDIWGGKTPQETYEMYYSALKKGDIDLASKYFAGVEGKARGKDGLKELKNEGKLEEYVSELPKWEELEEREYWDKDGKEFVLLKYFNKEHIVRAPNGAEIVSPAGEYVVFDIIFQLSFSNQIWKIDEL